MGNIKLEDVKEKLDKYFADVTPEQLEKDLKDAGLGFYTEQAPRAEVTLDCGVSLPTWEEANEKFCKCEELTPLENFILHQEPASEAPRDKFRLLLKNALEFVKAN
jgi:hypothetical protein